MSPLSPDMSNERDWVVLGKLKDDKAKAWMALGIPAMYDPKTKRLVFPSR